MMADLRDFSSGRERVEPRLQTPRHAGYRNGMSATHLIGNRLARVYEVAADVPGDMGSVLRNLDGKVRGSR